MAAEREFTFEGYGMAVSGTVGNEIIPTQAICGIPSAGGLTRTNQSDFRFDETFSFKNATAAASGRFDEDRRAWQSVVQIGIEGCNIRDVVQIDRIQLVLRSSYPEQGGPALRNALGTRFEGFRIAGTPVQIELDPTLEQNSDRRRIPSSLATRIDANLTNVRVDHNRITIPEFGALRVADASITREGIQVTMLGIDLESKPKTGRIYFATGMLRGHPLPLTDIRPDDLPAYQRQSDEKLRMDEDDLEEVLTEMRLWASSHPNPKEPFLFFMGQTLSPIEFLSEVEGRSTMGVVFLNILVDQAKRSDQRPRQFVARAVEANRPR